MVSVSKLDILLFTVLITVCVMVCTGAPSNSPTKSPIRFQREANKTSSRTTSTKITNGRSAINKTSSVPTPSKTLSRHTRMAPAGNGSISSYTNVRSNSPDTVTANKQQTGAGKQSNTPLSHHQQVRSANGTTVSEPSSGTKSVPLRRVPARRQQLPKTSSEDEDTGSFVVSSHVPVRTSSLNRNRTTTSATVASVKRPSNSAFIQHEDGDH